ncbi:Glutamate synthase [NADPH] small chain [Dehalobacter sp. UNSWDHB]|jgi:glutamate synthase (NADPH), homotetrameric|uniref:NADPH-dependent glutamate synthase n=1 Tax=unclassified Dehalobacter TaxID=2635733 RepID=UPI00028B5C5F|nr:MULTISPECIES: NADPH-dependent glutamate synthase [unclassified Dehalobacter]AFV03255.1 Glutamate synthase [NADPH] small chain [Dehalobacter sp. DCA]AFV06241.1 Glutamate synthase [NADPH] small chain [Dehalobacter sp. CF]EQB21009.1 Glutamate synthase [NADPH] small chain [Dehalobacter sp. UNSWDHB]
MASKAPRHDMPCQDPIIRGKNFSEVALGYPVETAVEEAERCIQCKKPKCVEGCPVGVDISEFLKKIAEGEFLEAASLLKSKNTLPAICGRVCPQETQCEAQCILGVKGEPVAIGRLERFAADYEMAKGTSKLEKVAPTGKKVVIIGAGPAGLTCAAELARKGHAVTVLEALHVAGGVLMYGIPEFRLPKAIVQKEINSLKDMGVEILVNQVVGKVTSVQELLASGYDAAFIGTGAGLPYFMNIPGENFNGVYSANEFLTRSNLMKAYDFPNHATPIKVGEQVAVLGGGNVAMDAARTALRLGAKEVYIVYRRSMVELPARLEEVHHAEEEGIQFKILTNPVTINGDENGNVKSMTCLKYELGEPDASGRRRPVPIEGSEFELPVQTVVVSIGQGPNPLVTTTTEGLELNKWGNIVADETTMATSIPGVYAGGDIVTGAATVILAMGAGKTAAASIDTYLKTK